MVMSTVVKHFHCRSRTCVSPLPPKMPSMSPETCAWAEKPLPTKVGTCQRMKSQEPWLSPVHITAFRCVPAQPSTVQMKRLASLLFSMPPTHSWTASKAYLPPPPIHATSVFSTRTFPSLPSDATFEKSVLDHKPVTI